MKVKVSPDVFKKFNSIDGKNEGDSLYLSSNLCNKEPSKLRLKNTQKNIMCDNETKRKKLSTWPLSSYCYNKFSVLSYKDKDEEDEIVSQVNSICIKEKNKMKKIRKIQKTTKKLFQKKQFQESSENSYPDINRCSRCFISHFPNKNSVGGL